MVQSTQALLLVFIAKEVPGMTFPLIPASNQGTLPILPKRSQILACCLGEPNCGDLGTLHRSRSVFAAS